MTLPTLILPWLFLLAGASPNFQRARSLSLPEVREQVAGISLYAHWDAEGRGFWHMQRRFGKKTFHWVSLPDAAQRPLFDHAALAQALTKANGETVNADDLPLSAVTWNRDQNRLDFSAFGKTWRWQDSDQTLAPHTRGAAFAAEKNGRWAVFPDNGNLVAHDLKDKQRHTLTHDGSPLWAYGWEPSWYAMQPADAAAPPVPDACHVVWSPDHNRFVTFRIDRRHAKKLYLYQPAAADGFRAKVWQYERALPDDETLPSYSLHLFDLAQNRQIDVTMPATDAYPQWSLPQWSADGKTLWWVRHERAFRRVELLAIDAATGQSRVLRRDQSDTFIDINHHQFHVLPERREILWSHDGDGWNHLLLLDGETGAVKQRLTQGDWMLQNIEHVDEKKGLLVFSANGREADVDPYFRQLYRLDLTNGAVTLLTDKTFHHQFQMSPTGDFFIDERSRVDQPPHFVLRHTRDGKAVKVLVKADIKPLTAAGWRAPEPFVVKARDGKTDLYGLMYLPADFDPSKRYPVIDATYSGPHAVNTPKGFARLLRRSEVGIAALGFVVVNIDGLGTARRGKAFQNASYHNLGDVGAPDHISALQQLARTRPWMDLDRVGIYGHSAGGYDTVRAMLMHPEFYKVGVSSAGNHDHRMAKIWWPELWMGRNGEHYQDQSNITHADKLQGHLLLVHGDMDNNVNPASSLRMAAALIEHDKDFELLLIPNRDHYLEDHPYFVRKRMEWFVRWLKPPNQTTAADADQ